MCKELWASNHRLNENAWTYGCLLHYFFWRVRSYRNYLINSQKWTTFQKNVLINSDFFSLIKHAHRAHGNRFLAIYLFIFSLPFKGQNDAAIEEADGVSFRTDGRYKTCKLCWSNESENFSKIYANSAHWCNLYILYLFLQCIRCFMDNTAPTIRHLQPCMNCRRA